jgi:hypothetical protein
MIPYVDLLRRSYSRSGLDPAGPLSCLGVVLILLARRGIAGPEQAPIGPRTDASPDLLGASRIDAPSGTDDGPSIAPRAEALAGARQASPATLQAEATLAAWASAVDSPWETMDPSAADRPQEADVWLLEADGDPAGLAVVACARQGLVVTSVPERGVCALKARMLRPSVRAVYRWKGAA